MKKRYEILAQVFSRNNRLLSQATNSYTKTHPLQSYFAHKSGDSPSKIYLHAEISALIRAAKSGKEIHTLRIVSKNSSKLPHPCRTCREAIAAFGVSKVIVEIESQSE